MNWQVYKYNGLTEVTVGRPGGWTKMQRKYERLVEKNPDTRYAIGRV